MFIWSPETLCSSVCPVLPCLSEKCKGSAKRKGLGRPCVVVGGDGGQYYIFATELKCNSCDHSTWYSDNPEFISRLPEVLQSMLPAYITYRKAVDWKIVDKIRRTGRSPADVANEINELSYLQYERAHLKYLLVIQSIREQVKKGSSVDKFVGFDDEQPSVSFGGFHDVNGWNGVLVSSEFISSCLVAEYQRQKETLYGLMKGTFGQFLRSDHTRSLARKVETHSGVMWSYATMNEYWQVVSSVLVDSETEENLRSFYAGLSKRYELANVVKPSYR